ncbi:hypothetical protein EUTSA_v10028830mg [Eutrema salsugineum]|uniref:BHLH domain-containing protein n=1 Tax=Eutrema salsugineum TaxID=72664 RepID=V4MZA0_EUTSA|nr:uncharacterized protein LOC18015222 [Eutrema salsugineum]XP_024010106.1 uncharacterized protein LOC18015222 [Eutrema salsugineum]ESQ37966.1 hypothetical protein EUTSA_v10028830mg [Eutrema salsugineum]
MERERRLSIACRNRGFGNHQNHHHFDASSQVKVENEETSLSLSQWLQPSKFPLSYLSLLNEESTPDENPPLDYVVEKVVLPSRDQASGSRALYSASESEGICSEKSGVLKVKPSTRVPSHTNNETFGSSSKVPVGVRSSRQSRKSEHPSSQNYSEKLRSWKGRSNNNNNRDFSQLYSRFKDVPSKKSNKTKSWSTECGRMRRIEDNINALGELLPHEVEDTPESILNDIIAHVKLLQLQMKELSRSRLGGDPISHPMISIEGYGHFIHQEQTKPLEELMADLLTKDYDAAASLLESKGLYMMPFSSI